MNIQEFISLKNGDIINFNGSREVRGIKKENFPLVVIQEPCIYDGLYRIELTPKEESNKVYFFSYIGLYEGVDDDVTLLEKL